MNTGSHGLKRLAAFTRPSTTSNYVCTSCRHALSHRKYASTATATIDSDVSPPQSHLTPDEPSFSPLPQPRYNINAGIVLSRPPILTPDPQPFETAYHLYQRRLNERLVLPFTQYFYYKRGTPAYEHWRAKRRERAGAAARDVGAYNAYSGEGWNDEVLVGNQDGNPEKIVKTLIDEEGRAAEFTSEGGDIALAGLRRITEADERDDQKSLERSLSRTLYLLVKTKFTDGPKNDEWSFPTTAVHGREGLKEAAQRTLFSACGVNMNTWFVGNHPIGHHVFQHQRKSAGKARISRVAAEPSTTSSESSSTPSNSPPTPEETIAGEKIFFMKGRIMAGQADIEGNELGIEDFKWLAKEEIRQAVSQQYWASVKNMLVEQ